MNSKLSKVLFAVIGGFLLGLSLIWVTQVYGGDYVTYTNPKTGVKYYGDALPPSAPTNAKIEIKRHDGVPTVGNSSNWNEAARGTAPRVPVSPNTNTNTQLKPSYDERALGPPNRVYEELMHQSNMPTPPSRDKAARNFNRTFDKYRQYDADMFEWRSQGRELRQQYNEPNGFGRDPTGFSQQEKRYYKSYAP